MNLNKFNDYVVKGILSNNEYGIKRVSNLKTTKTFCFSKNLYSEIEKNIKENNIKALTNGSIKEDKTSEYLTVMEFENEIGKHFIVTVYDSNFLWQDPQIIEIYPI